MANGATIVVKGEITASEDFVLTGRVEGDIQMDAGVLTLAEGSRVVGQVVAPTTIVNGQVEGSVTVTERLDVRPTAVIKGNLSSPVLILADGAQVTGRIEMPAATRAAVKFPVAV